MNLAHSSSVGQIIVPITHIVPMTGATCARRMVGEAVHTHARPRDTCIAERGW
ncbi:hypothetical protein [Chloroflexus sp.]|uniref:hypothetical protein n=1 Tax=Chloroflexus sp. TaxID=1904827 RepID=UPI002ADE1A43|nr:hypothetical protein [Chloroflexus sp.]